MLDLLDTFIGLVTIYLILALMTTSLGEGFSTHLNLRGAVILRLLEAMLGEAAAVRFRERKDFLELCEKQAGSFMNRYNAVQRHNGLTRLLPEDKGTFGVKTGAEGVEYYRAPSYLASEVFVTTLLKMVVGPDTESAVPVSVTPMALDRALTAAPSAGEAPYWPKLRQLWKDSNYDLPAFEESVRQWFVTTGERTHGWFKRDLGLYLFLTSMGIALFLNADTIYMFRMLTQDESLRQQYVDIAVKLSDTANATNEAANANVAASSATATGGAGSAGAQPMPGLAPEVTDAICASANVQGKACTEHLTKALLPTVLPVVGWDALEPPLSKMCWRLGDTTCEFSLEIVGALLVKLVGLLLTAAAISLGAPFWFDLLHKVIRVRGAIRGDDKPATTLPGQAEQPLVAALPRAKSLVTPQALVGAEPETLDQFHEKVFGFDLLNNYWTARLANISYLPEAEIRHALGLIGAEGKLVSYRKNLVDTQCLVAYTMKAAFVVFRGTEQNLADVVTDLKYVSRKLVFEVGVPDCMVHSGFHDALFNDDCWKNILDSEPMRHIRARGLPIWVCGHSLGGALALLFALRLKQELVAASSMALVAAVHTFGQPRVGNPALARLVDQAFPQRYFRSINNRDIVPRVPFAVMPEVAQGAAGIDLKPIEYAHAGHVLYFDELGRAVMDPPLWFRTLDTLDLGLTGDALKEKLREFAGDHSMVNYVKLHYALIRRAPAVSATALPVPAAAA